MKQRNDYYNSSVLKARTANIFKYIVLILYSLTTIYPLIWVILTSLKESGDIYNNPFGLPSVWKFGNYVQVLIGVKILPALLNTFFYSIVSTAIVILLSFMTAYMLARIYTKPLFYIYFTLGIMIPIHAIIVPLYSMMNKLNLVDTRTGIILIYVALNLSFSIFILVPFMRNVPKEIEEAAMIDGANIPRIAFTVVLPIVKPGLATIGTFTFINCWNDFLVALIMATIPQLKTINLAVFNLRGLYMLDFGLMSAGLAWVIIPVAIIYVIFQEQVIKGLTAGAVKG